MIKGIILLSICSMGQPEITEKRTYDENVVNSSVRIEASNASGSGTVLDIGQDNGVGLVISNKHVIRWGGNQDDDVWINFPIGIKVKGKVWAVDQKSDLAMIKFEKDRLDLRLLKGVQLDSGTPRGGLEILKLGYPKGVFLANEGTILGYRKKFLPMKGEIGGEAASGWDLVVSFGLIPGDSGSGVFNKTNWKLVGVSWGRLGAGDGSGEIDSCGIGLKDIRRFVDEDIRPMLNEFDFGI